MFLCCVSTDEKGYMLQDPEFEITNNFTFAELLAAPKRKELFKVTSLRIVLLLFQSLLKMVFYIFMFMFMLQNKIFYITPGVVPSPACLREIIEHAGGSVDKQRRTLKEIIELNSGGVRGFGSHIANHFHGPHNSISSSSSLNAFSSPTSNHLSSPPLNSLPSSASDSNSQASLTNGPSTNALSTNSHSSPTVNDVNSEGPNKQTPTLTSVDSNNIQSGAEGSVANGSSPTGSKSELKVVEREVKDDIKSDMSDVREDEKKPVTSDSNHDIKKQDCVNEIDEKKKELMKPPAPVAFPGSREMKLVLPEKTHDGKREPLYLVISVLNDLHLVKDLMKAKIGEFYQFYQSYCH